MFSLFPVLLIVYLYVQYLSLQLNYWKDSQRGVEYNVVYYPSTHLISVQQAIAMSSISVSAHPTTSSPFPTSTSPSTLPSVSSNRIQPASPSSLEEQVEQKPPLLPVFYLLWYCELFSN